MQRVQNHAARLIIGNFDYINCCGIDLVKSLNLYTMRDRRDYLLTLFSQSCLKFVYEFEKCQLPKYFLSQCVPRSSIHDHDTRNASNIDTIYTRTKLASKCIRSQLPLLLNDTSDIILSKINTHNIHDFSFFIKRYYVAQYSPQCHDRECFVCNI